MEISSYAFQEIDEMVRKKSKLLQLCLCFFFIFSLYWTLRGQGGLASRELGKREGGLSFRTGANPLYDYLLFQSKERAEPYCSVNGDSLIVGGGFKHGTPNNNYMTLKLT